MTKAKATVRMYNQENLGDCFLLTFEAGEKETNLLIDFGSYTDNSKREKVIAAHIQKSIGSKPLYVAVTHQHKDHLSGFISGAAELKKIKIAELWLSFLDNASSDAGKKLRKLSEAYWKKNKSLMHLAGKESKNNNAVALMLEKKKGFDLFAEDQSNGAAYTNLLSWAEEVKYFEPGKVFDMPGLPKNTVKVYVLGPPTDYKQLKKMKPGKKEAVHDLAGLLHLDASSTLMLEALTERNAHEKQLSGFPFSKRYGKRAPDKKRAAASLEPEALYYNKENDWRRIDHDWMSEMGSLALHMDRLTNNTSLVLAFELVESGKVLLFAGDAQIGNWSSWFDVEFDDAAVNAEALLKRTVFYKSGHHSSHNATLAKGLDLMNEKELVIFIPVNQKVSDAQNFLMLKPPMMKGYNRKAKGRVVRSDTLFHKAGVSGYQFPFAKTRAAFKGKLVTESKSDTAPGLYVEHTIE